MLKCIRTGIEYYYDEILDELRFQPPSDAVWAILLKTGVKKETLGYSEEWQTYEDRDENIFYFNKLSLKAKWEKPVEAIKIPIKETYCTAYVVSNRINSDSLIFSLFI